jgi:hypothetical protein
MGLLGLTDLPSFSDVGEMSKKELKVFKKLALQRNEFNLIKGIENEHQAQAFINRDKWSTYKRLITIAGFIAISVISPASLWSFVKSFVG